MNVISMRSNCFALSPTPRSEQPHPRFGNATLVRQYLYRGQRDHTAMENYIRVCEAQNQDPQDPNYGRYSATLPRLKNNLKDLEVNLRKGERLLRQHEQLEQLVQLGSAISLGFNDLLDTRELDKMMGFSSGPPVKIEDLSTLRGMPAPFCNRVVAEINQEDQPRSRKSGHSGWWSLKWLLGGKQ